MTTQPDSGELVTAVSRWLASGGNGAFARRVAGNALDIVARELRLGPAAAACKCERLAHITGSTGTIAKLEALLCAMIRDARIAPTDPRLLDHLHASALEDLAIDQPRYVHELLPA